MDAIRRGGCGHQFDCSLNSRGCAVRASTDDKLCVMLCLLFLRVALRMISGNTMQPIGTFYIGVNGTKVSGIIAPGERRKAMEVVYGGKL